MEWFSRADDGDLAVPKSLDGFSPSSDSWSQWDSTPFGNFKTEMKRNSIRSCVGAEDCKVTGNGLSNDMKHFGISEEAFDNAASQDSYCDMDQWSSYPPDQLDFHLDNMASIDQLDDVFLSSLLEDGPTGMGASDESSNLSTDSRCSMLLDDDQGRDEHSNLEHMTSSSCAGTAKYFSAHASTPVDGECQEVNNSYLLKKAPQAEVAAKLEHDRGDSRVSDEEISLEESVLQHLENLTSQLTEETRICFRDSLYRLADNSKHDACQSRNAMPDQDSTWFSKEETTESRTNVIDRTVANLLFSSVEFGASEGSSLYLTEATNTRQHSGGISWNISGSSGCDVPTFSR